MNLQLVVLKDELVARFGSLIPQELSNIDAIYGVFEHTMLEALAKLLIEFPAILILLYNFNKHLEAFLHQSLLDQPPAAFVLLERLSRDVQWQDVEHKYHFPFKERSILLTCNIFTLAHAHKLIFVDLFQL